MRIYPRVTRQFLQLEAAMRRRSYTSPLQIFDLHGLFGIQVTPFAQSVPGHRPTVLTCVMEFRKARSKVNLVKLLWTPVLVLALLYTSGCDMKRNPGAVEPRTAKVITRAPTMPIEAVFLHRKGSSGPHSPTYRITLKKDGSVVFIGVISVSKIGTYVAKIDRTEFSRLEEMIWHFRLLEIDETFYIKLDQDRVEFRISDGNKEKQIVHGSNGQTPIELWAIETLIDGIVANVVDWKRSD